MNDQFDFTVVDQILERYPKNELSTIAILQDIQEYYHYLPQEVFPHVAAAIGVGEARLFGVATFYENFSLEPKGLALGSCSHGGLRPGQEGLLSFWRRKASDHVGASGC